MLYRIYVDRDVDDECWYVDVFMPTSKQRQNTTGTIREWKLLDCSRHREDVEASLQEFAEITGEELKDGTTFRGI